MSNQFRVDYRSYGWLIQADLYQEPMTSALWRLGTVQKEMGRDTETGSYTDWQPATIDCQILGQGMTREHLQLMRDTLDELERIADMLDANPVIPSDNTESDMLTDGVSSASL